MRGVFLVGGLVNNLEIFLYYLEIFFFYKEYNDLLCDLLNEFQLNSKMFEWKKGYIIYLKEVEKIIEFLNVIGVYNLFL